LNSPVFYGFYFKNIVFNLYDPLFLFILIREIAGLAKPLDHKTALQELVQRESGQVLKYCLTGEEGPDHDKKFFVTVELNGEPLGSGQGHSKKLAEQMAAKAAIQKLNG